MKKVLECALQQNKLVSRILFLVMIVALSLTLISGTSATSSFQKSSFGFRHNVNTSSDPFRSNITVPVVRNVTLSPLNDDVIELPSQMIPTTLTMDIANGFEPVQRLNSSQFNATIARQSNLVNASLKRDNDGLSLYFRANSTFIASIATYNLSFLNPLNVSGTKFFSFALSTSNTFNSSQVRLGISLSLRDQQGNRHYISIEVSDQYKMDIFDLSEWFLGWGFTEEYPKYPHYSIRYGSTYGPWFIQLSLQESFALLNLSSAWLDGLLIGGEIFSRPLPYSLAEVNATFHFALVHAQLFMVNQQVVNSTALSLPYQKSLVFSGLSYKSVNVSVAGYLEPTIEDEWSENDTMRTYEVFFDLFKALEAGVHVEGNINVTVFSRSVKKCILILDNTTFIDLTDTLLSYNVVIYNFPKTAGTLKVVLIHYKFNAWIFSFLFLDVINITKSGIVEEWFLTVGNEGVIEINATVRENTHVAIRTDGLTPRAITIDDMEEPLESVLIIDEETYFIVPIVGSGNDFSSYTVEYMLSERPLYESSTVNPFYVHFNGSVFRIFTPFNVEGEQGFYIPITVHMLTYRTFVLRIEYGSSFFEAKQNEIMAYSNRRHYEYFMLKPLQSGQSTFTLKIIDPITGKTYFSSLFLVRVSGSFVYQLILYALVSVTGFSIVIAFLGKNFVKRGRIIGKKIFGRFK